MNISLAIGASPVLFANRKIVKKQNTSYDLRGHLLIRVMGNYDKQEPTNEHVQAISDLMAWSVDNYNLSSQKISGHFELADTGCPGTHLRELLEDGSILQSVEKQLIKFTEEQ